MNRSQPMTDNASTTQANAKQEAERIASSGENVRERTRQIVTEALRKPASLAEDASNIARSVFDGAIEGVRSLTPEEQDSALRKVIDGVGDALSKTANATRFALEEAKGRGEAFAKEDIDSTIEDLRALETMFVDLVGRTAKRAGTELSGQFGDLVDHAKSTASNIRPSIESALDSATSHPVQLTGETAAAGVKAVPKAAGMLLSALGGALQGAGEALGGSRSGEDDDS